MRQKNKIKVLTVDDHPLMREGIAAIINDETDMEIIGEASNGKEAIEKFRALRPDVTLLDLRLPDLGGIDVLINIRKEITTARVIILTTFEGDMEAFRAIKAGAFGFALKSVETGELTAMIRQVHKGRKMIPKEIAESLAENLGREQLTRRETEILELIAKGFRNREIGEKLFIAEETVKGHIKSILGKLGAVSRTQAAAIAAQRGIIRY